MDYKLTVNDNNDCEVIKPAGQDFVRTCVCEGEAKAIIATASKVESSDKFEGFVSLDGGKIFIAVEPEKAKPSKAEKPADEAKAEPKKKASAKKK